MIYASSAAAADAANTRLFLERTAHNAAKGTNERLEEINKNIEEMKSLMYDMIMIMKYTNQTAYAQANLQKAYEETLVDGES